MKANRLFEMIYILLEKKTVTARELAERFEVSERTIYRDVDVLSHTGIPIYMKKGRGGGISLLPDFVLNKAVLTVRERDDIMSSMKAVNTLALTGNDTLMEKLGSMLGKRNTDWIEVDFSSWGVNEHEAEYFNLLKSAIIEKRVVTFIYASGKAEKLDREVLPLKLLFKGAAWYLYGLCRLRNDYRFFKLRRIENLFAHEEHFDLDAPERIIDKKPNYPNAFIRTELHISARMAFRVYDEVTQFTVNEQGNFRCELFLPDIDTICVYASSFGADCTIISPPDAVREMKSRLKNSLENYL